MTQNGNPKKSPSICSVFILGCFPGKHWASLSEVKGWSPEFPWLGSGQGEGSERTESEHVPHASLFLAGFCRCLPGLVLSSLSPGPPWEHVIAPSHRPSSTLHTVWKGRLLLGCGDRDRLNPTLWDMQALEPSALEKSS